jgi:regulatory protein
MAARSLKAQALQMLAQREHSRVELRRKLLVRAAAAADASESGEAPVAEVDALIDWLEAQRYFSPQRFVESRVHLRAPRFGNLRIRQELARHEVALAPDAAQALADSEFDRARLVWARKFGAPAGDAAGRAKQARFLGGRGFSPEVIRRVLRLAGASEDQADE